MGDKWSIQWTQSAAKNGVSYIVVSGDRLEAKGVARNESYTVKIARKGDDTSVESIETEKITFRIENGVMTTGNEVTHMEIYTPEGQLVRCCNGNSLSLAGLSKGRLYIVKGTDNAAVHTYKFLLE